MAQRRGLGEAERFHFHTKDNFFLHRDLPRVSRHQEAKSLHFFSGYLIVIIWHPEAVLDFAAGAVVEDQAVVASVVGDPGDEEHPEGEGEDEGKPSLINRGVLALMTNGSLKKSRFLYDALLLCS